MTDIVKHRLNWVAIAATLSAVTVGSNVLTITATIGNKLGKLDQIDARTIRNEGRLNQNESAINELNGRQNRQSDSIKFLYVNHEN